MNIKKHVPNIITLLNLFCGCIAVVYTSNKDFEMAFLFVCLGIFLDFFDGFFARLFKVSSPLGLQLDSLADMVTSGVVPGYVMYQMLSLRSNSLGEFLPFFGFIITLGACYRLANFNIDTRQTSSFIGLPTPANALFILSLSIIGSIYEFKNINEIVSNQYFLIAISILSAYIMNAEIPLFALKIKEFNFKSNKLQLFFIAVSIVLLVFLKFLALPIIILFYVLLSVFNNRKSKTEIL